MAVFPLFSDPSLCPSFLVLAELRWNGPNLHDLLHSVSVTIIDPVKEEEG